MELLEPINIEYIKSDVVNCKINGKIIKLKKYNDFTPNHENIEETINKISRQMEKQADLIGINAEIGNTNLLRISDIILHDLTDDYLKRCAEQFTLEREKISIRRFVSKIYGLDSASFAFTDDLDGFQRKVQEIVEAEYEKQSEIFIANNYKEMNPKNEIWKLYWLNGPGLNSRVFDFSKIRNKNIRKETMVYFKEKLKTETDFRNDKGIALITMGMNYICSHNQEINSFLDIEKTDISALLMYLETDARTEHNKSLTPNTIRKTVQNCGMVVDYIVNYYRDNEHGFYKDMDNPFDDVHFPNLRNMEENSKPIPDLVFDQLNLYKHELNIRYQLLFDIFENTGLRAKDVVRLEAGSATYDEKERAWSLKVKNHKSLKERRKKHLPDDQRLVITENLAIAIRKQETDTQDLREEFGLPFIFVNKADRGHKIALTQAQAFVDALNRIARKHKILDLDGELWHFTSRQYRKTVAINMVENGATGQEISAQLNHLNPRTAIKYYAEVKKMRLAELNSDFFQKKFNIIVGEEKLSLYTEEERRVLYTDFCLKYREVELGLCSKHQSLGPCGLRTGKTNCAICNKLCTGLKYLDKWISLRNSQQKIVDELLRVYSNENINDYAEFKEYQREVFLLRSYQNVIDSIQGNEVNSSEKPNGSY